MRARNSYLLTLLSGILLLLSYPPFNLEFLAWFAFVPVLVAIYYERKAGRTERLTSLKSTGVSVRNITVKEGVHSGIAQIIVDKRGETIIAVAPGANSLFSLGDITFPEHSGETVVSLFQNEIPQASTEAIIRECKKRKMLVLWNIAPACQKPAGRSGLYREKNLPSLIHKANRDK